MFVNYTKRNGNDHLSLQVERLPKEPSKNVGNAPQVQPSENEYAQLAGIVGQQRADKFNVT